MANRRLGLVERRLAKVKGNRVTITQYGRRRLRELIGLSRNGIDEAGRSLQKYNQRSSPREQYRYSASSYANILAILTRRFGKNLTNRKFLEIGSYKHDFLRALHALGAQPFGLDYKQHFPPFEGMTFKTGDLRNLKEHFPEEKFDGIIVRGVLEYGSGLEGGLTDEQQHEFFEALRNKIRPGGVAILEHYHAPASLLRERELEKHGFSLFSFQPSDSKFGVKRKKYGDVGIWIAVRKSTQ